MFKLIRIKSLFVLLITCSILTALSAQEKNATKTDKNTQEKIKVENFFWCSLCDYSASKSGVCPVHRSILVKGGLYYCLGDEANASANNGKCKDGTLKIKMDEEMIRKNKEASVEMIQKEKMMENKK